MDVIQRRFRMLAVAVMALLSAACSSVKTDFYVEDRDKLGGWSSYRWASAPMVLEEGLSDNFVAINNQVRLAVDKKMAEKGYVLVGGDQASDISVDYRFGSELHVSEDGLASSTDYMEQGFLTTPDYNTVGSEFYKHQSLSYFQIKGVLFSVLDEDSGRMVWQGLARTIDNDDSNFISEKEAHEVVTELVDKVFADLPDAGQK